MSNPSWRGIAVGGAAQPNRDLAQGAVVDVDDAPPGDAAHVEALLVAPVHVVVDQRAQQVVRDRYSREVAGEMQVDVLHRDDLRVTAARCAALHAEHRAERRLAQADDGLLADPIQRVAETHRHRGLAFTRRRRGHCRHQDQLAVRAAVDVLAVVERQLRLVTPEGMQVFLGDAESLHPERDDGLHRRALGDLDVGEWRRSRHLFVPYFMPWRSRAALNRARLAAGHSCFGS